jgi:hypothetical protein
MINKKKAVFSEGNRTYDTGGTCDESNASGQTIVKVAAPTSTMVAADRVILGRGTAREEEGVIDSVSADVSITLLANLAYNHTIDKEQTLDQESAAAQAKVYITSTADLLAGETVVISSGEAEEETGVILSINANDYITLTGDLANTHAVGRKVNQTGIGDVVEVIMLTLSTAIDKSHCKRMAIRLPSTWQTAGITFLGCNTPDGTFTQVVKATDIAEVAIASVAASKTIGMDGIVMQALESIPFIKLRSGVAATPVDQKAGKTIDIMLME